MTSESEAVGLWYVECAVGGPTQTPPGPWGGSHGGGEEGSDSRVATELFEVGGPVVVWTSFVRSPGRVPSSDTPAPPPRGYSQASPDASRRPSRRRAASCSTHLTSLAPDLSVSTQGPQGRGLGVVIPLPRRRPSTFTVSRWVLGGRVADG